MLPEHLLDDLAVSNAGHKRFFASDAGLKHLIDVRIGSPRLFGKPAAKIMLYE